MVVMHDGIDTDLHSPTDSPVPPEAAGEIPADVRRELDRLDEGEISTALTRGNNLLLLMLCGRTTDLPEGFREEMRQRLFNQRLESYANGYLEELRAEAIIREDG